MAGRKRRVEQIGPESSESTLHPLPVRRTDETKAPSRKIAKIDKALAYACVNGAFERRLAHIVKAGARTVAQKKQNLAEEELKEKLDETKQDILAAKSIPRGILDQADEFGNHPAKTVAKSLGSNHEVLPRWRSFINHKFDELFADAWMQYRQYAQEELAKTVGQTYLPVADRLRMVGVKLKSIVRADLPQDYKYLFMDKLENTATIISDIIANVAATTRALMMETARRGFVTHNAVHVTLNTEDEATLLSIDNFLPEDVQRKKSCLVDEKFIPVSPILQHTKSIPKNSDFYQLFRQEHVQTIYSRFLGSSRQSGQPSNKHPLWDQLEAPGFDLTPRDAPGLGVTISVAVQAFATNLQNMWTPALFNRSLDRLLLVYFRVHLAPNREKHYKALVDKKSNESESHKQETPKPSRSRDATWQRLRLERKLQEKCARRIAGSSPGSAEQSRWEKRARLSLARAERDRKRLHDDRQQQNVPTEDVTMGEDSALSSPGSHASGDVTMIEAPTRAVLPDLQGGATDTETVVIDRLLEHGIAPDDIIELAMNDDLTGADNDDEVSEMEHSAEITKDTSARKITSLKAITKKLLLAKTASSSLEQEMKKAWTYSEGLTNEEVACVKQIFASLEQFIPPKDAPTTSIALRLPLVILSNIVQRVAGYQTFARNICPYISPASVHGLSIDATTMYEMMGSSAVSCNFNMYDYNNMPITSPQWAGQNKQATLASFLDIEKAKKICSERGMVFENRLVYKASSRSVDLLGELRPDINQAISFSDQRRKMKSGKPFQIKTPTAAEKRNAAKIDEDVRVYLAEIKRENAKLREAVNKVAMLKRFRKTEPDKERQAETYREIKAAKLQRCTLLSGINKMKLAVKDLRSKKYGLLYSADTSSRKSEPLPPRVPRMCFPAHEDRAEHVKLDQLLADAKQNNRKVAFSGTDYGVQTMSTSVSMSMEQYNQCIELYNRFSPLASGTARNEEDMDTDENRDVTLVSRSEKPVRVTAGEIDQRSLSRKFRRKRERRKARNPAVVASEKVVGQNSMKVAVTAADVFERHKACREQQQVLREFYLSNVARKERYTQNLFTDSAYDRIAASERKRLGKNREQLLVMCIGDGGTGVGSRIGGYARRGGTKMRGRHRRHTTVVITNEHRTSQTCSTCFGSIIHPTRQVLVRERWRSRTVSGTSICLNHLCPSYRLGRNSKNRDTEAARCITIAGISRTLTGTTLPPFSPKPSQSHTGFPLYRGPPVKGAASVAT